jgi:hypothetical protein
MIANPELIRGPWRRHRLPHPLLPEDPKATIDADFANDVQAAVESHREALDSTAWE